MDFLAHAAPRIVRPVPSFGHAVVFTDAACEDDCRVVTGGAVLRIPGQPLKFFGYDVPRRLVDSWAAGVAGSAKKVQVIGQAEIHPVLVAKRRWAEDLVGGWVVFFVDNNSARDSLIRSYSPVLESCRLRSHFGSSHFCKRL